MSPPFEVFANGSFGAVYEEAKQYGPHIVATWNTFVGREDLNSDVRDVPGPSLTCETGLASAGSDWIGRRIADKRVLLFNEDHMHVGPRAFLLELLPELKRRGFLHLGLEALVPVSGRQLQHGLAAEGFYTAEPIFAAVIRRARELGFDVFGYEADGWSLPSMTAAERANAREQGQARNLQREIARWPKKEKFVIFAGFAHIRNDFLMRGPATGDVRSMASYLAQWTGIDPLSVDLTACAYAAPEPETVQGRIFLQANGRPLISAGYAGSVDGQIRLPVSDGKSVSPGYYRHLLGIAVEVPNGLHPQDEAVLVEAREVDGDINAIAYDRILLRPGERFPLYLKAGREFELVSYAASGALRGRARVHVGGNEHRH